MSEHLKFEVYEQELLDPLRGHALTEIERFIASLLLDATTASPVGIVAIMQAWETHTGKRISDRIVKGVIRRLRKEHAFPILARRSEKPTGYWWCASAAEMEVFIESFRSQALDELHTLSMIVKHNYPALIGQLKFDET